MATAIRGLLVDIDGVLTISWEPIDGAVQAFAGLRESAVPYRLATNTTSRSRESVAQALVDAGFPVEPTDILTAPIATASYLAEHHPKASVFVLSSGDLGADFADVDIVDEGSDADVVVLGGAGLVYTNEQLNHAFNLLLDGATFIAMHRNLYWRTGRGMELDTGAYVMALEASTGLSPVVMGKPAPAFFEAGMLALGTASSETMMIGDDLFNDVVGAQATGMIGCLVRTGKFRPEILASSADKPDHVVDSIVEAVDLALEG